MKTYLSILGLAIVSWAVSISSAFAQPSGSSPDGWFTVNKFSDGGLAEMRIGSGLLEVAPGGGQTYSMEARITSANPRSNLRLVERRRIQLKDCAAGRGTLERLKSNGEVRDAEAADWSQPEMRMLDGWALVLCQHGQAAVAAEALKRGDGGVRFAIALTELDGSFMAVAEGPGERRTWNIHRPRQVLLVNTQAYRAQDGTRINQKYGVPLDDCQKDRGMVLIVRSETQVQGIDFNLNDSSQVQLNTLVREICKRA